MDQPDLQEQEKIASRGLFRLRSFIIVVFICAIVPVAAAGLTDLYKNILERNQPIIDLVEVPRGIGLSPVSVKFRVRDADAGLDEAVVRIRQKGPARELMRVKYKDQFSEELVVNLDAENSALDEGIAVVEVRAFDRSFWSNAAELTLQLRVDFRKPKLEVLSSQHNARVGGSQLVFYKAFDEDLAISGIKIGNQTFMGFPATGIDKELTDPSLHVALYAVDIERIGLVDELKLFAEDKVGNAISTSFYNKISERPNKNSTIQVSEELMREKISALAEQARIKLGVRTDKDNLADRAVNDFKIVNEGLRQFSDNEILSQISKSPRHESYWSGPFLKQSSIVQQSFAERVTYLYEGREVGSSVSHGEQLILPRGQKDVLAAAGGIVIFAQDMGIYGWTLGIDHGLGVTSVYGHLSAAALQKGASVQQGQVIGQLGNSGFARNQQLYFEMRVQGVPVDPREWSDTSWFYNQILGKVNDIKKMLGIPVYIPLERGL